MERDQLEKLTRDYQQLQEQLQALAMQKEQFKGQKEELKQAVEEAEKAKGKIFLAIGGIMVDVDKDTAIKSLKEKQDSNAMRLTIVEKQFDEASKKEQSLRSDITTALKDFKQQD
ncbi:MAG: prefoldin subunit [Candidatus Micrarchaeota archaeon]|nr:prefoldin subunit [Candidatus Micrarchaeota archaeon]